MMLLILRSLGLAVGIRISVPSSTSVKISAPGFRGPSLEPFGRPRVRGICHVNVLGRLTVMKCQYNAIKPQEGQN